MAKDSNTQGGTQTGTQTGSAPSVLDEAARAGWMYYIGGMTQDQIAAELGVSRQRAQRLVSRAMSEGLIHVRLEHRIASCIALEAELIRRFELRHARVVPTVGAGDQTRSIAPEAARLLEGFLANPEPLTIAMGTGRALRAMVEELTQMDCEQHKLVSLIGNISPDGTASNYDVIMRIADKIRAPHYPMPLPVIVESAQVREMFYALAQMQTVEALAARADVTFVGIGQMSDSAPLYVDGFITKSDLHEQQAAGAVGEICSWVFDSQGRYLDTAHNQRVGGLRAGGQEGGQVIALAAGDAKVQPIHAALKGKLINGLVTCEETARAVLDR